MTLRWKLVNLSSSNISTQASSRENVENRCFIAEARKEGNKMPLQMILCEQRAFAERLVCAKRGHFGYVSLDYHQARSEKWQPSPNNLLQRRCPSAESPAPQCDLSCFMTGHKGSTAIYSNLFWNKCLLGVVFQQPLPSEKNIHGWWFPSNAKGISLNPFTFYLSDLFHTYYGSLHHFTEKRFWVRKHISVTAAGVIPNVHIREESRKQS